MAVKQMRTGGDKSLDSSNIQDIEDSMQQSSSEIIELKRKLTELELLAESKLKKKQEMIESVNKQLRDEKKEKEILYEKVCVHYGIRFSILTECSMLMDKYHIIFSFK